VVSRTGATVRLSNGLVAVELDAASGAVRRITAPDVETTWGEPFSPFVVVAEDRTGHRPEETWWHGPERDVTAFSAPAEVKVERQGNALLAQAAWQTPEGLHIRLWIAVLPGDPVTYWRLSVRNANPDALVDTLHFPVLRAPA
jgi:hypothetical protein